MVIGFRRTAFWASWMLLVACTPKLIPGTPFPDTKDTREILEIIARYRRAFEAKDAQAIAELSSVHYLDRQSLISHETLLTNLQGDFDKIKDVHLDIKVNRVQIEGDKAQIDYFYNSTYQVATNDPNWKTQSDDKRMLLRREGGVWRVTNGF